MAMENVNTIVNETIEAEVISDENGNVTADATQSAEPVENKNARMTVTTVEEANDVLAIAGGFGVKGSVSAECFGAHYMSCGALHSFSQPLLVYKNVNGNVVYSGYSLAVSAIPESSGDNSNIEPFYCVLSHRVDILHCRTRENLITPVFIDQRYIYSVFWGLLPYNIPD